MDSNWMVLAQEPSVALSLTASSTLRFKNETTASAMVLKQLGNRHISPVFILSMGTLPLIADRWSITSKATLAIFFAPREEGEQFSELPAGAYVLAYDRYGNHDVHFDAEGVWRT